MGRWKAGPVELLAGVGGGELVIGNVCFLCAPNVVSFPVSSVFLCGPSVVYIRLFVLGVLLLSTVFVLVGVMVVVGAIGVECVMLLLVIGSVRLLYEHVVNFVGGYSGKSLVLYCVWLPSCVVALAPYLEKSLCGWEL